MSNRTTWLIAAIASLTLVAGVAIAQIGSGATTPTSTTSTTIDDNGGLRPDGVSDDAPGDISGNCDEAEHANDPECAGGGASDDSSDDRSGSSGSGSDDNSGHGGSDDNSGSDDSNDD
jgi:hypothetical protein